MSSAFRRTLRAGAIVLIAGFAPVASAVGRTGNLSAEARADRASPALRQAVSETASASAIEGFISEATQVHRQADADRRAAKAVEAEAARLKPGEYVWRPEGAPADGNVEIVVSLAAQRAYVFRDRKLIGVSTVSTGREGHRTPTGSFPILERKREHYSNLYDNAPMPNMQRLTWDGIALHAGNVPGYAASHGCVRLPMELSDLLFGVTRRGNIVHVVADTPPSAMSALNQAMRAAALADARSAARSIGRTGSGSARAR